MVNSSPAEEEPQKVSDQLIFRLRARGLHLIFHCFPVFFFSFDFRGFFDLFGFHDQRKLRLIIFHCFPVFFFRGFPYFTLLRLFVYANQG